MKSTGIAVFILVLSLAFLVARIVVLTLGDNFLLGDVLHILWGVSLGTGIIFQAIEHVQFLRWKRKQGKSVREKKLEIYHDFPELREVTFHVTDQDGIPVRQEETIYDRDEVERMIEDGG